MEAEAGAAVKHVEIDTGAVAEDVVQVLELGGRGGRVWMRVAPVIEPAGPVLGDEEGLVGLEGGEEIHLFLVLAEAEVDSGEDAGDAAVGEFIAAIDGVEEGAGVAGTEEDVAHVGHVGVGGVGCGDKAAVFVFNLGDDDGAAAADLERGDLLAEASDPALGGDHEGGIVGAEGGGHARVFEEPGGEAAELPLGAGVGAGAEDDPEAFFLRGFNEGDEVVVAVEVEVVGGGLVNVPEDVGGDGVEAHGAGHFEAGVPVLAGDAGVVEFAGENLEGLAVEGEVVAFDGEGVGVLGECGESG